MPLRDVGVSVVDVRDIAEAAAIVLTSGEHDGKTYNLNGPEVISGAKAASIWGEVPGKEIRYTGHNVDGLRSRCARQPAFDIRMMFEGYLERGFVAGWRNREVDQSPWARSSQI